MECAHEWKLKKNRNKVHYYCVTCGLFSQTQTVEPEAGLTTETATVENERDKFEKCKHAWQTLGNDRVHAAKGKAGNKKYICYKCINCGKFQRRTTK